MRVRAKFRCEKVEQAMIGTDEYRTYELNAVKDGSAENEAFWRWTPSGTLKLQSVNPNVQIEAGKEYYIDISPATAETAAEAS